MSIQTYGHWWRGRAVFERGLWRFGATQDLLALQAGIAFGLGGVTVFLELWSIDVTRLKPAIFT